VELHGRLTVLVGENGQGKTNVLEAAYLLASLRSFRTARLAECIQWGTAGARVFASVERRARRPEIEVRLSPGGRRVTVDGKVLQSAREYQGDLGAVLFTPEDLALARGSPELRRRFLDRGAFGVAPAHLADLLDYARALRARNALLKMGRGTGPEAEAHEASLARRGARIVARRLRWVQALRPRLVEVFGEIAASHGQAGLSYEPSAPGVGESTPEDDIEAALHTEIERGRARDLMRGYTAAGPHAEDVALSLGDRPLRVAGSQGQQRAFVLALKLAEIDEVREVLGEPPVLLLDDVGSELDAKRRARLLSHLDRTPGQVVLTTTAPALIPLGGDRATYRVVSGRLERNI
jgi:DNA replication and repair protein RecF